MNFKKDDSIPFRTGAYTKLVFEVHFFKDLNYEIWNIIEIENRK